LLQRRLERRDALLDALARSLATGAGATFLGFLGSSVKDRRRTKFYNLRNRIVHGDVRRMGSPEANTALVVDMKGCMPPRHSISIALLDLPIASSVCSRSDRRAAPLRQWQHDADSACIEPQRDIHHAPSCPGCKSWCHSSVTNPSPSPLPPPSSTRS